MNKKILLFSYNPVPSEQYKTIEGSALRFWRMALELRNKGYTDITIAVWQKFKQEIPIVEGIKLVNFTDNAADIMKVSSGADVIIFSCAMGFLSQQILDNIPKKAVAIVDAYSPMYVEFLTKSLDKSEDKKQLEHMATYIKVFNEGLIRADVILIASESQKHLYRGVLAGIGQLVKHDDSRFVYLPAFPEKNKGHKVGNITKENNKSPMKFLWFGGIYPWFDIDEIVEVFSDPKIKPSATLDIVGGSNPFYPKDNMRFNGKYNNAFNKAKELGLLDKTVKFIDWVEYNDRLRIFDEHDIGISVNSITVENDYSFRLRVADMVGNGLPIATNGGDPLCEDLICRELAFRIVIGNKKGLKSSLLRLIENKEAIRSARNRLRTDEYESLHLSGHIDNLCKVIESNKIKSNKIDTTRAQEPQDSLVDSSNSADLLLSSVSTRQIIHIALSRLKKVAKVRLKIEK